MTAPTETPTEAWVPDLGSFGARLALVRQKMGWGNVAEAARECGLDRESWRLWEQTGREPRRFITIAMAISARTGVDLDWLVYGPSRPTREGVTLREPPSPRIDPLAARVVAGQVQHYDKRRRSSGRVTPVRSTARPATSTAPKRPVSLLARA